MKINRYIIITCCYIGISVAHLNSTIDDTTVSVTSTMQLPVETIVILNQTTTPVFQTPVPTTTVAAPTVETPPVGSALMEELSVSQNSPPPAPAPIVIAPAPVVSAAASSSVEAEAPSPSPPISALQEPSSLPAAVVNGIAAVEAPLTIAAEDSGMAFSGASQKSYNFIYLALIAIFSYLIQ